MSLEQGFHAGVPMEDYIRDCAPGPSLSSSIAHTLISRSSLHAWWAHPRLNPKWEPDDNGDFDLGSAAHAIVLEQDYDKLAVYDGKDWKKKEAQEFRDAARQQNKIPVLRKQHDAIEAMVDTCMNAVERCDDVRGIFKRGKAELTGIWKEGQTWCRIRPDWLTDSYDLLINYKTTGNAEPDAFIRGPLVQHGYDLAAGFYLRGTKAITGKRPHHVWIAQEVKPPYAVSIVGMGPQMDAIGLEKARYALALWQVCLESGKWSGYRNEIHWADLPEYAASRFEAVMEYANA